MKLKPIIRRYLREEYPQTKIWLWAAFLSSKSRKPFVMSANLKAIFSYLKKKATS